MSAGYYKYQAYDALGKIQSGQVNAESEREALKILQGKKLVPIKASRIIMMQATNKAGKASRAMIAATKMPQTEQGIRIRVMPLARATRM